MTFGSNTDTLQANRECHIKTSPRRLAAYTSTNKGDGQAVPSS